MDRGGDDRSARQRVFYVGGPAEGHAARGDAERPRSRSRQRRAVAPEKGRDLLLGQWRNDAAEGRERNTTRIFEDTPRPDGAEAGRRSSAGGRRISAQRPCLLWRLHQGARPPRE